MTDPMGLGGATPSSEDPRRAARAAGFDTRSGLQSWTVVDCEGAPIRPLEDYLKSLRAVGRSENTVKNYARHLSLYWRWLDARQLRWDYVTFPEVADFIGAYRAGVTPLERRGGGRRADMSVTAVAAAVKEFYDYHRIEGRGPQSLELTKAVSTSGGTAYKFLAHVEKKHRVSVNRLTAGIKPKHSMLKVIGFDEDFDLMIAAAMTWRDKLLLSAIYEGGLRIGQALGLRHEDLDIAARDVVIERREDNVNGALSKTRETYRVRMPRRFFDFYSRYLLDELISGDIEDDMLFVNLSRGAAYGRPMSFPNAYQQVLAIGRRSGVGHTNPHLLRHTHATYLAKTGWTNAQIASRIGQQHASSADRYIHLGSDDLAAAVRDFYRRGEAREAAPDEP